MRCRRLHHHKYACQPTVPTRTGKQDSEHETLVPDISAVAVRAPSTSTCLLWYMPDSALPGEVLFAKWHMVVHDLGGGGVRCAAAGRGRLRRYVV